MGFIQRTWDSLSWGPCQSDQGLRGTNSVLASSLGDAYCWHLRWRFKCNSKTYPGLNLQETRQPYKDQKRLGFFLLVSCVIAFQLPRTVVGCLAKFGRGLSCQDSQESIVDQFPFSCSHCGVPPSTQLLIWQVFCCSILRIRFNAVRWVGSNLERQQCTLYGR